MSTSIESPRVAPRDLRIAVLGLGHVGLPTALGFAELGWHVVGSDEDTEKVRLLQAGEAPFYEPGLQTLLAKQLASGRFTLSGDVADVARAGNVLFVCVGTPQCENGEADLTQIELIAQTIARNLNGYKLIVEKSTVPAITALWIKRTITRYASVRAHSEGENCSWSRAFSRGPAQESLGYTFDVASNPEFLREGRAIEDVLHPDRLILGVDTDRARQILETIYRPLKRPILVTDPTTAELIKHAANAFLSSKISYINMVADLCEAVGADVTMVAKGLGMDPRIGPEFLSAGIGYGGYCFPKDLRAFIHLAEEHGVDCSILKEVERVNQQRAEAFLKKLRKALWIVQGKAIGILGLAFKPHTDDIREAPSLRVIEALTEAGARMRLYDPQAMPSMRKVFPDQPGKIAYCSSPYEACQGVHALALLTEWDEFRALDLRRVRNLMELPILVDGRNMFDPEKVREAGLEYISVGRSSSGPVRTSPLGLGFLPTENLGYVETARS